MQSDFSLIIRIPSVFFMVLFLISPINADQLTLNNGDILSGSLIGIADGKLVWVNTVLGELEIDQNMIATIQTNQSFDLDTDFGLLKNCMLMTQGQRQFLECKTQKLALESWRWVSLLAYEIDSKNAIENSFQKNGEVKISLEETSGNSNSEKYDVDATLIIKHKEMRHTFAFEIDNDKTSDEKIKDEWKFSYVYDHFITQKWFVSANTSYEEDEFKNLDHKTSIGLGAGYQFVQNSTISLSSTAGFNYMEQEQTTGEKDDSSALRLMLDYRWKPFQGEKSMEFYHKNELINALSGASYYTFESLTGINFPINGRLHSVLEYEYDYNSEPAVGKDSSDRKWSVGVRYKW